MVNLTPENSKTRKLLISTLFEDYYNIPLLYQSARQNHQKG